MFAPVASGRFAHSFSAVPLQIVQLVLAAGGNISQAIEVFPDEAGVGAALCATVEAAAKARRRQYSIVSAF